MTDVNLPAADPSPPAESTRFRLDIAYDGTDFRGWARQPSLRTVQGLIEDALAEIFQRYDWHPSLVVAGRTDAGVHAAGQVAHLDVPANLVTSLRAHAHRPVHPKRATKYSESDVADPALAELLRRRLGGMLARDRDVVVLRAREAPPGFDARFSATWRRYQYRLSDSPATRDPLQRHRTTWHPTTLDSEAMDVAAASLVGLHDFAAYCKPRPGATTIRTLQQFRWRRDSDSVLVADVTADAFCHSMVRALVGACVAVGAGRLSASDVIELRDGRVRTSEFKVLNARGLTLMEVGYPPDSDVGLRAEQTRARRGTLARDIRDFTLRKAGLQDLFTVVDGFAPPEG